MTDRDRVTFPLARNTVIALATGVLVAASAGLAIAAGFSSTRPARPEVIATDRPTSTSEASAAAKVATAPVTPSRAATAALKPERTTAKPAAPVRRPDSDRKVTRPGAESDDDDGETDDHEVVTPPVRDEEEREDELDEESPDAEEGALGVGYPGEPGIVFQEPGKEEAQATPHE